MTAYAPGSGPNKLRGIPFVGVLKPEEMAWGDVYYVNSANGSDGGSGQRGKDPSTPFKTIDYAIGQCAANNADTIIVLPGHSETLTAAGSVTMDVPGVRVVGFGFGHLKPQISFSTAATASWLISAANCTVENIYFDFTGIDELANPISITAADCKLRSIEGLMNDAAGQAVYGVVTTAGADRLVIDSCRFWSGTSDAGSNAAICIVGGDGIQILNTWINGYFGDTTGCIESKTTSTTNTIVDGCRLVNQTASSNVALAFIANATGMVITNNRFGVLAGTAPVVAANAALVGGNYYKAAKGVAAGTLL